MSDYTVGDTCHFMFTTRSFSTGAPTQLAGSPVVSAYEDDSVTQITAGITLGVDHDSVTGMNLLTVVASGANGFESGKDYHLVITTGTVGGVSVVGEVVGRFTLGRSAAAVDLANGTDGLGAIKATADAIETDTQDLQSKLGTPSDFGSGTSTVAANLQDMADNGTATFDRSTDSLQAIRDHVGDGTNLTEAGGTGDQLTALATAASISALNDVAATDIVSGGAITTSGGIASADTKKINGVTITGDGSATPFNV